jgi:hypothetical protein
MKSHDDHEEAAIYWSAVSLIVCEGLPVKKAAKKLGMSDAQLREILQRRQELPDPPPYPPTRPIAPPCAG